MVNYKRCFGVACELMMGSVLYGKDFDSIFEELMETNGCVDCFSMMQYIEEHIDELDRCFMWK